MDRLREQLVEKFNKYLNLSYDEALKKSKIEEAKKLSVVFTFSLLDP
jgi:hypothetical protein